MKKYELKSVGEKPGSQYLDGDFAISNPSAVKEKKNYEWSASLIKKIQQSHLYTHQKLSVKKKNKINEIIANTNTYRDANTTIIIKDEKKIKNIYIYADIWARDFKISNLKEKLIGKFEIKENKLAIYFYDYIYFLNSPNISKFAKNGKMSVKEYVKKLNSRYFEVKLMNGIYDAYEISDKKPLLNPRYDLIMSPDDDELDDQLILGCCLRIKN